MLCRAATANQILTDLQVQLRSQVPDIQFVTITDANDDDNGRTDANGDINLRNRNFPGGEVIIPNLDIKFCEGKNGLKGICITTTDGSANSFEAVKIDPVQVGLDIKATLNIKKYNAARIDLSGSAKGSGRVMQIEWFASVNDNRVDDQNHKPFSDRLRFDNFGPLPKDFSDSITDDNNKGDGPVKFVGVFDLDFGRGDPDKQTLRLPDSAFVGVAVPAQIKGGKAKQVGKGETGGAQVSISGTFIFSRNIDLSASTVTVNSLLNEVEGAGELVKGTGGVDILPIDLFPRDGSTPTAAIFETSSGARPSFRMEIKTREEGVFEFNLKVDRATIPAFPKLCAGGTRPKTNLTTSFVINDGVNPVVVSTEQAWRCLDLVDVLRAPPALSPRSLRVP
jgi:hypothetical protein